MQAAAPIVDTYQGVWKPFFAIQATQTAVQTIATILPGISITDS